MPILTSNGFSSWGGGKKGKEWLQDTWTHGFATVHTAARVPDGSVSSLGALDAFYILRGQLSELLVEYA